MTQITSATNSTTAGPTASSPSSQSDPLLDKDAFLKLMMVQLEHQDPLQPTDPNQYISQLAQLTTLEQTTNMAAASQRTAASESTVAALALLGHSVTYIDANEMPQTGTVEKVQLTTSGPSLTISGVSGIDPSAVSEVS